VTDIHNLNGKRVVITGGSKGLGRALTEALVKLNVRVAALARQSPELAELEHLDNAYPIPCDLKAGGSIKAAINDAAEILGGIDILINNAGIAAPVPFDAITDEMVDDQIAVNFTAAVHTCRAAMPWLRASEGHILNVSSETVRHVSPFLGVYAATKAALERFSQELRDEFRPDKVRVTILRSGTIATAISENWPRETMEDFLGRMVKCGYRDFSGVSVPPASMAEGIIKVLAMPSDLNLDIVEMRSAIPWFPE
jgi:NAD(P)-dependent dehydrogenase (short-subunit alcohol dehydrogenase family)